MQVKVINQSKHPLPAYQTALSAGLDLRANLEEPVVLHPLERKLIGTGLFIELAAGYEAQIRPRSGLAFKHGLSVLNSPGTIDADYRGEIKVLLVNLSDEPFTVNDGERIAQMLVAKHEQIQWEEVLDLSQTERGAGGYGSTGRLKALFRNHFGSKFVPFQGSKRGQDQAYRLYSASPTIRSTPIRMALELKTLMNITGRYTVKLWLGLVLFGWFSIVDAHPQRSVPTLSKKEQKKQFQQAQADRLFIEG